MNPKLRIMTIRLMGKMAEYPVYAASVGVTWKEACNRPIGASGQNEIYETARRHRVLHL